VRWYRSSGQSLIEFVLIALLLFIIVFAIIDIGRAIYRRQILVNLSREGANLASRGTSLTDTLAALVRSADPLNITNDGRIILTAIQRDSSGIPTVVSQQSTGGLTTVQSHIAPNGGPGVSLPNNDIPQPNRTLYTAEVFYTYTAVTPLGKLIALTLPTIQYDAAYF
jgi:Flp pilus assembly protein TadG